MYEIVSSLSLEEHERLIEICVENATVFTLTKEESLSKESYGEMDTFPKELSKNEITSFETRSWHGYYQVEGRALPLKVYVYKSDNYALKVLKRHTKNLFLKDVIDSGFKLHDICFFRDKTLFLGTISHESLCNFFPFDSKVKSEILSLGEWLEFPCHEDHQTKLNSNFKPINDSSFLMRKFTRG